MTRRSSLPGASELFFRSTAGTAGAGDRGADHPGAGEAEIAAPQAGPAGGAGEAGDSGQGGGPPSGGVSASGARRGSPRTKHDTKITVYISEEELLALEQSRLALRSDYELAVDRGRLVREAVALVLSDFEERGSASVLVERLSAAAGGGVSGST